MTVQEFFAKYDGKGIDFDGVYGFQCVDVIQAYNKEVVGGARWWGNAIDYWKNYDKNSYTQIANTPTNTPQLGDVIIWGSGVGQYGHVGICKEGATVNNFVSFDQNWPLNSLCHSQPHSYNGVLGWIRPKNLPQSVQVPTVPLEKYQTDLGSKQVIIDQLIQQIEDEQTKYNELSKEFSAILDGKNKLTVDYQQMVDEVSSLHTQLADAQHANGLLLEQAKLGQLVQAILNIIWKKNS